MTITVLLRAIRLNPTTSGRKYCLKSGKLDDAHGSRARDVTRLIALALFATPNIAPATIAHRHPTSNIFRETKRMRPSIYVANQSTY